MPRRAAATLLVLLAATMTMLAWPGGHASAHAQLLTISPADGEVLQDPPRDVVLTFNEPVSLTGGAVRVLDDAAAVVSDAAVQAGVTITVPMPSGSADGTYTVTWEVVSEDSHRITGASVFHVGAPSSAGLDVASLVPHDDVAWGVRVGAVTLSGIAYAGALIAAGALWFSRVIDRRPARAGPAGDGDDTGNDGAGGFVPLGAVVVRAAVLGAVTLVAAVPFRIARVGGGLDSLRDNDVLASELRGPIGLAMAVTSVSLLVLAVVIERRWSVWIGGVAAMAALVGFTLEGHSRANHPRWAMIGGDAVHLVGASVWLGGIVGLIVAFRTSLGVRRLAELVRRFSASALLAVAVISVTGVIMAWIILPTAGELVSTGYGLALVVKVALVIVVIGLGALNRWWLVPAVSGETTRRPGEPPEAARRRLSRIVLAELALLLIVIGVTAVLVTRSPVTATSAAAPPSTAAPQVLDLELSSDGGTVEVSLTPGRVGANAVSLMLRDVEGRIINPVDAPVVEFTQPAVDVGPLRPEVSALDIGHYQATADLGFPGEWEMVVRVRVSDFVSATATGTVTID